MANPLWDRKWSSATTTTNRFINESVGMCEYCCFGTTNFGWTGVQTGVNFLNICISYTHTRIMECLTIYQAMLWFNEWIFYYTDFITRIFQLFCKQKVWMNNINHCLAHLRLVKCCLYVQSSLIFRSHKLHLNIKSFILIVLNWSKNIIYMWICLSLSLL